MQAQLPLRPQQQEDAWLCYYLAAVGSRVWTSFTPQPSDFWQWSARAPDELYSDPAVQDILTALDQNVPLAWVRHQRTLARETHSHAR